MITTNVTSTPITSYRCFDDDAILLLRRIYHVNPHNPVAFAVLGAYKPMLAAQLARHRRNGSRGDWVRRVRAAIATNPHVCEV